MIRGAEVGVVNHDVDLWPRQRHVTSHVIPNLLHMAPSLGSKDGLNVKF